MSDGEGGVIVKEQPIYVLAQLVLFVHCDATQRFFEGITFSNQEYK